MPAILRTRFYSVKNVLSTTQVEQFNKAAKKLYEESTQADANCPSAKSSLYYQSGNQSSGKIVCAIERSDQFDTLLDHNPVFRILLALMGPHLKVLRTEIFFREASPQPCVRWHTDGGPSLGRFVYTSENPILQLKVQYFLTDLSHPNSGNLTVVPGSHRQRFPAIGNERQYFKPSGAQQLLTQPGDVVIFLWSLWHSVSANASTHVRRGITFRYGQPWCRSYDYTDISPHCITRLSPRQALLFGHTGQAHQPHHFYYPDTHPVEDIMPNTLPANPIP